MPKEPQSYGSQSDWVTGNTGEEVNRQKSEPGPEHDDFYNSRRDAEDSGAHQGGEVSEIQAAENVQPFQGPASGGEDAAPKKVADQDTGAKRGGFFKDRDYE